MYELEGFGTADTLGFPKLTRHSVGLGAHSSAMDILGPHGKCVAGGMPWVWPRFHTSLNHMASPL